MKLGFIERVAALTVAALMLAGAVGCEEERNADFGYADEVITVGTYGSENTVEGLSGDTDIVTIETVGFDYGLFRAERPCSIRVVMKNDRCLAQTDSRGEVDSWDFCDIERLNEDGTVTACGAGASRNVSPFDIVVLYPDSTHVIATDFPFFSEPGTYRVTYYFRNVMDENLPVKQNLGDEEYELSHTVVVPEITDRPFDLLSLDSRGYNPGLKRGFEHTYSDTDKKVTLMLTLRRNGEKTLFAESSKLEWLKDGEWEEMPAVEGRESSVGTLRSYPEEDDERIVLVRADGYFPDTEADYRMTIRFAENEDGSGEEYVLTLNLKLA